MLTYSPIQKGYDAHSSSWFNTDSLELSNIIEHLQRRVIMTDKVIEYIETGTSSEVRKVQVATIKDDYKRSKSDSAKLIIAKLKDGTIIAKRFNNNQYVKI